MYNLLELLVIILSHSTHNTTDAWGNRGSA